MSNEQTTSSTWPKEALFVSVPRLHRWSLCGWKYNKACCVSNECGRQSVWPVCLFAFPPLLIIVWNNTSVAPHTHIWMVVNGDNVVDFFPDYATVTSVKICHLDIYCGDELLNALVRKKNKKPPNYKQIYENCGNTSIKAVQGFLIWTINYIICVDNMSSYPALEQK